MLIQLHAQLCKDVATDPKFSAGTVPQIKT